MKRFVCMFFVLFFSTANPLTEGTSKTTVPVPQDDGPKGEFIFQYVHWCHLHGGAFIWIGRDDGYCVGINTPHR